MTTGSPRDVPSDEVATVAPTLLPRESLRRVDGRMLHVYGQDGDVERAHALKTDAAPGEPPDLHLRCDPLTAEWIAFSPARNRRPQSAAPQGGEGCPFCPWGPEIPFPFELAVFDNRFPPLLVEPPPPRHPEPDPVLRIAPSAGHSEVVVYTPAHEGSLVTLTLQQLVNVVAVWRDRTTALWADDRNAYVFTFENRGEAIGATLTHPHGQIYAFNALPPLIARRDQVLRAHRETEGGCLTCAVVAADSTDERRQLDVNDTFSVGVPFAPRWPYEVHIRARRHGAGRLGDLTEDEVVDLARALRAVVYRYDELYGHPFSYMMVVHEAPRGQPDCHLSFEFLPPHRSRHARKVPASVETATGFFINDTTPEVSASELRANAHPEADWSQVRVPRIAELAPPPRGRREPQVS